MHQMHFIYLVVLWNDCHDDMIFFVVHVIVFLVIQLCLFTIIVICIFFLNSLHNCFFTRQVQYPEVYALYGIEECLINTKYHIPKIPLMVIQIFFSIIVQDLM